MLLAQSWWGLVVRNCGGQLQRRPGLSLMGLAACTTLISSLSLKQTDWPCTCMSPAPAARLTSNQPTSGCTGPVIQHWWPWPISGPCRGLPQQSQFTVYIFISAATPRVSSSFLFLQPSPPPPSLFESLPFLFISFSRHCLFGPPWPPALLLAHASFIQEMKTESRRTEEEERQQVVLALEEEKEGLTSRCATLQADLDESERQAKSQQDQRDAAQARVKVWKWGQVVSDTLLHGESFQKINTLEVAFLKPWALI